ncbi:AMP-binding protein [Rhizobium rhizosphaerae]|nr:AMP-binding protein [Xaviernesmea rhizosphaerae]
MTGVFPSQPTSPRLMDAIGDSESRALFCCEDGAELVLGQMLALAEQAGFRETRRRLVFCLSDNDPGGLLGYLALMRAGAVPAMLGTALPGERIAALINVYRPDFLWLPEKRVAEFADLVPVHDAHGYWLLGAQAGEGHALHPDLALLLATSGSTGSPKFVRLSHTNLHANAAAIVRYLALTPKDRPVTTLPPAYSYGLSVLHSHLLAGSTIALTARTFFDRGFWDVLRSAGVTSLAGVPYHYEMLKKLRFASMDLPALNTLTQAGGRMDPALTREFATLCAERGMRFFSMYGQTEATARMAYLSPDKAIRKAGSIGQPIPGGRFRLIDAEGAPVEGSDMAGELVYEGPNVCLGYAEGAADLALGDVFGGTLRTGDLAQRDAEGDYTIVGRLKRFLKLFGYRVNLEDIERALIADGHAVACAGRDDLLEIYLVEGTPEIGKAIKSRLVSEIKVAPQGIKVHAVAALPRGDNGKIRYGDLDGLSRETLA